MSKREHYLVGHILRVLRENHVSFDQMVEGDSWQVPQTVDKEFHTAVEIIRFMDEMPGGFLIYRADGDEEIVYANRALLRIFQCETIGQFRVLTGNSFRGLVHPEDLEAVEESIQTQIAASQYDLDYVEYRIIRSDGAIRWIEDYGHFIEDVNSGSFFYVFLTDATEKRERHLAEKARLMDEKLRGEQKLENLIREYDKERALINQEYLRRLEVIEGLSINYESIFYIDLEEDQILPYRQSTRSGPIFDGQMNMRSFSWTVAGYVNGWVHPEDRKMLSAALSPASIREKLKDSQTCYINYRAVNEGQTQYLQMRIVDVGPQCPANQIVMGCLRMDEELRREMEQKQVLAQALKEATLAINTKNIFLSNMSHDMRTPLNAIFGFLTLARGSQTDAAALQGYLEQIEGASQRLLDLINKVLELAQAEAGELRVTEERCDLGEILRSVKSGLETRAAERKIHLSLDCSQVTHWEIWSDREKVQQILRHLAANAIAYSSPGGEVKITAAEGEMMPNRRALYRLTVEDNGIGISQEFQEHIFEPFAREKNTTYSGVHGVGLGLTIAKKLTDLLDGRIEVSSVPGQGSTFTVTLRLRTAPQPASGPAEAHPEAGTRKEKILLVEDNEINLEIETEILKAQGFSVSAARDGREAVEKISRSAPGEYDLILMDIQMPVMNGWEATEAIRLLPDVKLAGLPIIAVSANSFENDIRKSLESGMDAHLPKPLNVPLLLETIERVTRERRDLNEI